MDFWVADFECFIEVIVRFLVGPQKTNFTLEMGRIKILVQFNKVLKCKIHELLNLKIQSHFSTDPDLGSANLKFDFQNWKN